MKYIEYLEEQRIRDERNHKLLGALDRVDNSLSLMTAKTDKLNVLRVSFLFPILFQYFFFCFFDVHLNNTYINFACTENIILSCTMMLLI